MRDEGSAQAEEAARAAMTGKDGIVHAQTRALLTYWEGLRRGQLVPFRSQIDPRELGCDIGNLFILEALPDGAQRFRVAGSRIVDMFGMEVRGLPVRTIMASEGREALHALIAETLTEPAIAYARLRPDAGTHALWEMLLLPLRSDDGTIDRAIGYMFQLAGARSPEMPMPLRLTFERRSIERIEQPPAVPGGQAPGLAEEAEGFAGEPGDGGARLRAIDGGSAEPGPRRRPKLRLVGDE